MSTINLNNVSGTYSNCIYSNYDLLTSMFNNQTTSVQDLKSTILEITKSSSNTQAKRKFLLSLERITNKVDLISYMTNIMLRADHTSSNPDDKWANEK